MADDRLLDLSGLLFSVTDRRGNAIRTNPALAWLTGHASRDPVLHPDMPQAITRMLRDNLARDLPFVGYMRVLAAEGGDVWVLAAFTPSPQGIIRMGIKPTSPLFSRITALYPHLCAAEAEGRSPEDSALAFAGLLQQAGFRDHDAFMAEAMSQELTARLAAGHGRGHPFLGEYTRAGGLMARLAEEQHRLLDFFDSLRLLPTNMRILASRLEPTGGPVTAVSQSYQDSVFDIFEHLRRLGSRNNTGGRAGIAALLDAALLRLAFGLLVTEAVEGDKSLVPGSAERLMRHFEIEANDRLASASRAAGYLGQDCGRLRMRVIGLDQIRIQGEIESRRIGHGQRDLSVMMSGLDRHHREIRDRLEALITQVTLLCGSTGRSLA